MGKWEQARVQWLLANWFGSHEQEWGIIGSTEQRLQVSSTRVRIPDLVVLHPGPQPDVLSAPPLLVIEILSPEDTFSAIAARAEDYRAMGVDNVWIIDPTTRSGRMCRGLAWLAADRLEIPGTPLFLDLPQLFKKIGDRP